MTADKELSRQIHELAPAWVDTDFEWLYQSIVWHPSALIRRRVSDFPLFDMEYLIDRLITAGLKVRLKFVNDKAVASTLSNFRAEADSSVNAVALLTIDLLTKEVLHGRN